MTMITAGILALAFITALVAALEHLDCRARERRWQKALSSFGWDDQRTPMTDAPVVRRSFGEFGVTSCMKAGVPGNLHERWLNQRIGADLDNAREQLKAR